MYKLTHTVRVRNWVGMAKCYYYFTDDPTCVLINQGHVIANWHEQILIKGCIEGIRPEQEAI